MSRIGEEITVLECKQCEIPQSACPHWPIWVFTWADYEYWAHVGPIYKPKCKLCQNYAHIGPILDPYLKYAVFRIL